AALMSLVSVLPSAGPIGVSAIEASVARQVSPFATARTSSAVGKGCVAFSGMRTCTESRNRDLRTCTSRSRNGQETHDAYLPPASLLLKAHIRKASLTNQS
ncbi:hypothetical protein Vretimale_1576, partial [Volvox reticuliferus]